MPTDSNEFVAALQHFASAARRHPDIMLRKVEAMLEIYLEHESSEYQADESKLLRYYTNAVAFKFHLANLSLEQLWALSEHTRSDLVSALTNSLDRLDVSEDDLLLAAFSLEGFLFYARSFLDFFMILVCLLLRTGHEGAMSQDKFFKALRRTHQEPFASRATKIRSYFESSVFGLPTNGRLFPNNWGSLLASLRDRVSHRDRIRPSCESNETLAGKVLFNWPTLQQLTYDRFCQGMQNGMFSLFQEALPILLGLEWKRGPYREGMWK